MTSNYRKQVQMKINGYPVTLYFASENNLQLAGLVRSALIDSFLQQNARAAGAMYTKTAPS